MKLKLQILVSVLSISMGVSEIKSLHAPATVHAQDQQELWQRVQRLIQAGNPYGVAEIMASQGEPPNVARLYDSVANSLYRARDLRSTIIVAQKGIDYCLAQAVDAAGRDNSSLASELRGRAKQIAYNLGSRTWPGWNEPGIQIGTEELSIGFGAARLNLRLGEELQRGPEPISTAYWLLGAHALAAGLHKDAMEYFEKSAELARIAKSRPLELLAQGFRGLTRIAGKTAVDQGEAELNAAKQTIRAESAAESDFWIGQLDTAYRVFIR
jgi:hypothetical protein